MRPPLGTQTATQVCTLTGNRTGDPYGSQTRIQSTELHQPGLIFSLLITKQHPLAVKFKQWGDTYRSLCFLSSLPTVALSAPLSASGELLPPPSPISGSPGSTRRALPAPPRPCISTCFLPSPTPQDKSSIPPVWRETGVGGMVRGPHVFADPFLTPPQSVMNPTAPPRPAAASSPD